MRFLCLVFLLLASLAHGQAASPAKPPAADKSPEAKVGPDEPVITVNGFCPDPAPPGSACKTVITRAQFERLTEALQPGMSLPLRLKVANSYARMMRMAAAAEKRGLAQTPAFAEEMRYARIQLLSQDLTRTLQADANTLSDADSRTTISRTNLPSSKPPWLEFSFPAPNKQRPTPMRKQERRSRTTHKTKIKIKTKTKRMKRQ